MNRVRPWETLLIVGTASVLSALDLFVVNLAFPAIHGSFPDASNQSMSWVLSAYSILFAAFLVPAGRLADRYGRRRVFRIGLALFAIASAACAFAPGVWWLVAARAVKGAGAAMMVPTSLGLLLAAYPKERHTQMVAIWGATGSVAAALGPVLGGALVQLDWRLIFFINVPLAAVAVWRSARLAETPLGKGATPDLFGSSLLVFGIAALVAAISWAPEWGFASPKLIALAVTGVSLLGAFVYRCLTQPTPALDLRMFRVRPFLAATLGMGAFYTGFSTMLLGATLFLSSIWQWDALKAGEGFAFGPATAVVSALIAGKRGIAPKWLTLGGAAFYVLGCALWLLRLDVNSGWLTHYLPSLMLFGAGAGIAQTGFLSGGTASLPAAEYATGTAVLNTARQLGGAIGVALCIALVGPAKDPSDFARVWVAVAVCAVLSAASGVLAREPERAPVLAA